MTSKTTSVRRAPDCVTEVRMGNTILTVFGYFKLDATETAADKMAKFIGSTVAWDEKNREAMNDGVDKVSPSA